MRKLRIISAASIVLVLVPFLAAASAKAKTIVYLPWESPQHSRLKVSFDGAPVAEIQPGRFFVVNADPGHHILIAGEGVPTAVEVPLGGESYVRVARDIEIGPSGESDIPVLEVMSSEQALEQARLDMANLVYVKPKKIFSAAVSKEDPFLHGRPKLKTRNSSQ